MASKRVAQGRVRKQPQRTCIVCHSMQSKRQLYRIVRTPTGQIVVDATGKLPGRGAYLCVRKACWREALQHHHIDRALKVTLTPEQIAEIELFAGQLPDEAESIS